MEAELSLLSPSNCTYLANWQRNTFDVDTDTELCAGKKNRFPLVETYSKTELGGFEFQEKAPNDFGLKVCVRLVSSGLITCQVRRLGLMRLENPQL